ncbi:uncharacterized protein LOC143292763 [Babylonia areolata]|uniref:uncharacterized protein LOC143292763 n=1 Tax=Babylonia areolata TaxID=304850 RepID=UPI003FD6342C
MMGCQPQSSSHHSAAHSHAHYTLASHPPLQEILSVSQPVDSLEPFFVHTSPSVFPSTHHHHNSRSLGQHMPGQSEPASASSSYPSSSTDPGDCPSGVQSSPDTFVQHQQPPVYPAATVVSQYHHPPVSSSQSLQWPSGSAEPAPELSNLPGQQPAPLPHSPTDPHHFSTLHTSPQPPPPSSQHQQPSGRDKTDISQQQHFEDAKEPPQYSPSPAIVLQPPPPSFAGRSAEGVPSTSGEDTASCSHSHQQTSAGSTLSDSTQQKASCHPQWQPESLSPHLYQLSPTAYSTSMLEKKPTLQVVTTDHSPISPGSSAGSPRFVFPDMAASSSSGHLGSDSGSSPFMSPVKHEVKLEVGTPPQACELESSLQQGQRERRRMYSGDTELSEMLVDSETGSSLLEDSSSSREQSPFSAMAESLSLRSPSEHCPSPLTRKTSPHHTVFAASEEEEHADRGEEGGESATSQPDPEFHHSKFKRRLHERYVLSLKDMSGEECKVKEELCERGESSETDNPSDSKRPLSKMERSESPQHTDSSMPKSPRRSSSDTDIVLTESTEIGASSADEGDVFMEPTMRVRTKHKPPSLHQKEPLDLSRGPFCPGFRSSSGSSPLIDPEHLSPASKIFSPVFRSPHRLPYSPHGLMSPQSQSPLCSVPEGGRIFNFNVPSPLEGPHSDSDLISPSPMSPRIFTFPPPGSIPNPMAEVNRLAVSPRAPYTPPPSFVRGKPVSAGMLDPKWGEQQDFYSKRSLSESDVSYLCPVCGQVFPTNDNLAKHMTKHLPSETLRAGENNKVHYCKVCNRSFSRSDMLTRHMRLHTGLKPYECMDCGQVFSRSDHLNTHRRTHTGEKPYRCPHCPYAACRRDMITRHMRTHAKRSSRRARYLSVPDDGDSHKASGSISSTDTLDSQEYSTGVHTCSVSSVDSVESESVHSPQPTYLGASVDSLLSPGPHSSPPSRKVSEDLEEGMEGQEGGYNRFMHYRKARNWSTTSLESVDSEEAVLIREVLVDDAFQDPDPHPPASATGEGGSQEGVGLRASKDMGGLDTKTLQKCFISSQPAGSSSS